MSIYAELGARVNEERLVLLPPPDLPGATLKRQLYLSNELQRLITEPWLLEDLKNGSAGVEAAFDKYVTGERIAVRLPPSKDVEADMALLEPPAERVWEIRSFLAYPQM